MPDNDLLAAVDAVLKVRPEESVLIVMGEELVPLDMALDRLQEVRDEITKAQQELDSVRDSIARRQSIAAGPTYDPADAIKAEERQTMRSRERLAHEDEYGRK
jgi:hypothetical protein